MELKGKLKNKWQEIRDIFMEIATEDEKTTFKTLMKHNMVGAVTLFMWKVNEERLGVKNNG